MSSTKSTSAAAGIDPSGHVYEHCTRHTCEQCHGRGFILHAKRLKMSVAFDTTPIKNDNTFKVECAICRGTGLTPCSGCRGEGIDCMYESLGCCSVCGCYEGSLLPRCPGRRVSLAESEKFYKWYCEGIGPFARLTYHTATEAVEACYQYMAPRRLLGGMPYRAFSRARLYVAVCEMWLQVGRRLDVTTFNDPERRYIQVSRDAKGPDLATSDAVNTKTPTTEDTHAETDRTASRLGREKRGQPRGEGQGPVAECVRGAGAGTVGRRQVEALAQEVAPAAGWEFFCEHANENPNVCPCPASCGCRFYHCKGKP